ncbi:MAG: tetratricopeptide repeat protein [Myxococcales bacterium]|nr:tetratricopeptide repeat protein [Myxococcales bacterium]
MTTEALETELARLRAEHESADSAVARAILMHEIAVLEERSGDSSAAARDQLDAVNAEPEFHEPLERLIQIIQRSGSSKNLGKLLDRLSQVAEGAEERVRALLERAAHLVDVEVDTDTARAVLEEAAEEKPDDSAVFLSLEALAGKLGDGELRTRALSARAALCEHPAWRALLLLDSAQLSLEDGDTDTAVERIERAIEQKSQATYPALRALELVGNRSSRFDVVARSLESQAALLLRAESDAATGDSLGVPQHSRTAAHAADAWLRAADAHRRRGEVGDAAALLDQAIARVPDEPALSHARLVVAEVTGDTHKSAELAKGELERGAKGGIAAALWLRVAEAAASQGDSAQALEAVRRALTEDPGSIPARVLELDLVDSGADPAALSAALEAAAESMGSDEAKARYFLVAAETWSRLGSDVGGAKAALSQAGMYGASPLTVSRVARMLATLANDGAWYEEATRRLIGAHAAENELVGIWFELARSRLLRGDEEHARAALGSLRDSDAGRWLGSALEAYALPLLASDSEGKADAALASLVGLATEPAAGGALRMAMVLRALIGGRETDALEQLRALCADNPSNLAAAAALSSLARKREQPIGAAEALAANAAVAEDAELAAAFELEAGILFWQGGERARAVEAFTRAADRSPTAGGPVLAWALRAAEPDSVSARRRALTSSEDPGDGSQALERFGLEVGKEGDRDAALEALELVATSADAAVRDAGLLGRALYCADETREQALDDVAAFGGDAEAVARAALHLAELEAGTLDPSRRLETAAAWAHADDSVAPALEWLGASIAASDREAEAGARRALAERLPQGPAATVRASAAVVALFSGTEGEPLLDDDSPAARLTNLELAPPGSDPRRRARALRGVEGAFGEESTALARALAGWNLLVAGDADAALEAFRAVVEEHPEEIIGWEGLRVTGDLMGDRGVVAEASAALGDAVSDDARGAELWEESAFVLIDELGDTARGEFALSRAIARDIGRFKSFDKLFRLVRARKDRDRLLELVTLRLEVAEDPDEIAKLYWERARVLREAGDRDGALTALENVTLLEPDHVGALALSGEIYLTSGKLPEAAEKLARLSSLAEAPVKQRLMSGVAAVDIYENKLGDIDKALEVLDGLYRSGLSTLPVRERLARAAAKAQAWERATVVLEELMEEREESEGRIEAARLAMVIHRDRIGEPGAAAAAVTRLLAESPADGEALDLVLSGVFPPEIDRALLENGQAALVQGLMREPLDAERVDRLARVAARAENPPLRQAALGALVALGEGSPEVDHELTVLDQRVARVPQIAIDPRALPDLCDPHDAGPIPDLMIAMATTFADALGPNLSAFGVSKKERVDPRSGLPVRNEVAAWAGALGIGDFELYVGGPDDQGIFGVATETPAIVVGRAVQAPLSAAHRQALARELFALKRGTTILKHRDATDVAALVVATCRVGGYEMPSPQYAMLGEFLRVLTKEVSRKVKKLLPDLAARAAGRGQDPAEWVRAATSSLDRLASIAAGDVSWVLSGAGQPRGQLGASMESQERTSRLLAFVLSPNYLRLREQLGMGVR